MIFDIFWRYKASATGIDHDSARSQFAYGRVGKTRNTLSARRESIGQFTRHGDYLAVGRTDQCFCISKGLTQPLKSKSQRRSDLGCRYDPAVLTARRF